MAPFKKLNISALRAQMTKEQALERSTRASGTLTPTVESQRPRTEAKPNVDRQDGTIVYDDGYRLHGTLLEDGMWLEMYADRANGWVRGQLAITDDGPVLKIAVRDRRSGKVDDGKPHLLGFFSGQIPEHAVCRFSLVKH